MDTKLIEHAHRSLLYDLFDALWVMIKCRCRREDDRAHARELQHVLEMDFAQRGLAYHQHQLASLFEDHVRRSVNQIISITMRNGRKRADTTRTHHHPTCHER